MHLKITHMIWYNVLTLIRTDLEKIKFSELSLKQMFKNYISEKQSPSLKSLVSKVRKKPQMFKIR